MLINLRLGFASNSSSDHSIVFTKDKLQDVMTNHGMEFGWENFVCASTESKMKYLAAQLYSSFSTMMPADAAYVLACHLADVKVSKLARPVEFGEIGVDHQSIFAVPKRIDGGINLEFINDLRKFFRRPDVAVLGGNDNGESPRKDKDNPFSRRNALGSLFDCGGDWVARKQKGVWTLFNRADGTKVSFTFDDGPMENYKPLTPELVDMKITEVCRHACDYCYQRSSVNGRHAEIEQVNSLLWNIRDMNVFELVLGGGNVFMHPAFEEILDSATRELTVSFTTRSPQDIFIRPKLVEMIKEKTLRRIAVSCSHSTEIDNLARLQDKYDLGRGRNDLFSVNIIFENACEYDVRMHEKTWRLPKETKKANEDSKLNVKRLIETAWSHGFPVTLLGYKPCGNANMDARMMAVPDRFAAVLGSVLTGTYGTSPWAHLGIDTCLADRYSGQLKKAKVPSQLYYTKDGIRSWYIDAVQMKHGPSSYQPDLLVGLKGESLHPNGSPTFFQNAIKQEFRKVKP